MVRIVDRLKDLIKYKGNQVAPAELERLLASRDDVADVAVAADPDPEAGEIPRAYVVARRHIDPDELMAWVAERVSPHKRVRAVTFVDEIPRLPAGKILRRLLGTGRWCSSPAGTDHGWEQYWAHSPRPDPWPCRGRSTRFSPRPPGPSLRCERKPSIRRRRRPGGPGPRRAAARPHRHRRAEDPAQYEADSTAASISTGPTRAPST
jgi:hypothetical protein